MAIVPLKHEPHNVYIFASYFQENTRLDGKIVTMQRYVALALQDSSPRRMM